MRQKGEIRRARANLHASINEKLTDWGRYRAKLGDGAGNVRVLDKRNFAFARVEGRDQLLEVLNLRVPFRDNLPVIVAPTTETPNIWEVVSVDKYTLRQLGDFIYSAHHHESHEFKNPEGGDDVTWMRKQQYIPFLVFPTDPPSMQLIVYGDWYQYDGKLHYYKGELTPDLTGYLPVAPPNVGRYLLICLDNSSGLLTYTPSDDFNVLFPPFEMEDLLPLIPTDNTPLAAILLTVTTTDLGWWNIYDVRTYTNAIGSGIAGSPPIDHMVGSTYETLQDWVDVTQSAGRVSGGAITDAYPLINVASGTGIIKSIDAHVDNPMFFDWPAVNGLNPAAGHNWVYVDYNAGAPTVAVTNDWDAIDRHTQFTIAELWDDGVIFHILERGQNVYDGGSSRAHRNLEQMFGFRRGGGLIVTESGAARTVDVSVGFMCRGLNQIPQAHIDTDPGGAADTFTAVYRDGVGGWTEVAAQTAISNSQWDDGDGGLANLGVGRYGVFWVYVCFANMLYIQYGQGNYKLAQAEAASVPETMPFLTDFALLVARVIVLQGAATFYSVSFPWDEHFNFADIADHGNLDGLTDVVDHPDYFVLDGSRNVTGHVILDGAAKAIKGVGANVPTLGTTVDAEKWGHVYLAAERDIYPDNEENVFTGLMTRFINRAGLASYVSHGRVDPGLPFTVIPNTLYAAENPGFTGLLRGSYFTMYPSHATLPTFQVAHTADPITASARLFGRLLVTGGCEFGLWTDNYDSDRGYINGDRIYAFSAYLRGTGAVTDLLVRYSHTTMAGGVWPAWTHVNVSTQANLCPSSEGVVLMMMVNYAATVSRCYAYIIGEQGAQSGIGNAFLYDDAGVTPYGARRLGMFCRINTGFAQSCWDWFYLVGT